MEIFKKINFSSKQVLSCIKKGTHFSPKFCFSWIMPLVLHFSTMEKKTLTFILRKTNLLNMKTKQSSLEASHYISVVLSLCVTLSKNCPQLQSTRMWVVVM